MKLSGVASFASRRRLPVFALLAAVVVMGAGFRALGLRDNPPGFFADEASIGYNAYSILTTGRDEYGKVLPVFFRSFGEYKFPIFIYANIPFIAALGLTEQAVRLTAAAFGTLTIIAVFFLARGLFNEKAALAAAFLLAITPWHIHYSRIGFELVSFPLLLTTSLYLFFLGLKRPRVIPWSAAAFALTFYTYGAAWMIVPLLIGALAVLYGRRVAAYPRMALASALVFLVLLVPLAIHIASGHGQVRLGQTSILNLGLSPGETIARFVKFYSSYFSPDFLFRSGDNSFITRHFLPGYGHLYWFQPPLVILGVGLLLWRRTKVGVVLIWLLVIYPLSGALSDMSPISSRTILGPVVLALIAGYGTAQLAGAPAAIGKALAALFPISLAQGDVEGEDAVGHPRGRISGRWLKGRQRLLQVAMSTAAYGAVLVFVLWSVTGYVRYYHQQYPLRSADYWGWQFGPCEVVAYFKEVEADYDDLIMDGEFNAPYIFLKFYAPDGCPKCRIGDLSLYVRGRRQLFALKPTHLLPQYRYVTKHTILYPNGDVAFLLIETT